MTEVKGQVASRKGIEREGIKEGTGCTHELEEGDAGISAKEQELLYLECDTHPHNPC